jgi:hypothetical protein
MKMKFVFKLILILTFSLILGVGSAIVVAKSIKSVKKIGQWEIDTALGDTEANIYQKAYLAISAPYAISKTEAIYYLANADGNGDQLVSNCEYTIQTTKIDARWWNITVYSDRFLIPNKLNRYSYRSTELKTDANGQSTIYLSKLPKEGNWLPIGEQNELTLCLRIYHPSQNILNNPELIKLPIIIKEGCK